MLRQLTATPRHYKIKLNEAMFGQFYSLVQGLAGLKYQIRSFPSLSKNDLPKGKPARRMYWAVEGHKPDPYSFKVTQEEQKGDFFDLNR